MYSPATNLHIPNHIAEWSKLGLDSLCVCLEDSVSDDDLPAAEQGLIKLLTQTRVEIGKNILNINLFVRVQNPAQLSKFGKEIPELSNLIDGFIFPKFTINNANMYIRDFKKYFGNLTFQPTLETFEIMNIITRRETLVGIYNILWQNDRILGIRVGGADFCNFYSIRRRAHESIYDIRVIADCLSDIINLFARDYPVSAAVYEFFNTKDGKFKPEYLIKEARLDIFNGFSGKTVIHTSQIPIVKNAMKYNASEITEATRLLETDSKAVEKSTYGRMNEKTTHSNWANKVLKQEKL
jgi:citrate lyase beta subunit